MRNFVRSIVLSLFLLLSFSCCTFASDFATERVLLFKSDVTLEESTDIVITEEIHYYFPTSKHGMYRYIPIDYVSYSLLKRPSTVKLNDLYYYSADNPDTKYYSYSEYSDNGNDVLQIGDEDTYVQGEYVYVISYTLKNCVNYFDDYDELYLNITGNNWTVPIDSVEATIHLPGNVTNKVCYTGYDGSTESNCTYTDVSSTELLLTADSLLIGDGVTTVVAMPKGTLEDISFKQVLLMILVNLGLLLPIPVVIFLLPKVRKAKNKKLTLIPIYDVPKGMYPMLAGYVLSKSVIGKYATAEIIRLAIAGYIKIEQKGKKDYVLVKKKDISDNEPESVKKLFNALFDGKNEVDIKKLDSSFRMEFNSVSKNVSNDMTELGIQDKKKTSFASSLTTIGIILIIVSVAMFGISMSNGYFGTVLGLFVCAILFIVFGSSVDTFSIEGSKIKNELDGLKLYIKTAEEHRIEFHNDPKKYNGVFEKLLPYAIVFGLEKKWMKEFEDIYMQEPDWYVGDNFPMVFYSGRIVDSISNNMNSVVTVSSGSTHASSGGSGFSGGSSGGGFGGGGGGSW